MKKRLVLAFSPHLFSNSEYRIYSLYLTVRIELTGFTYNYHIYSIIISIFKISDTPDRANTADIDQTPQNAAFDQDLH